VGPETMSGDSPVAIESLEQVYRDHGDRLWRSVLAYSGDRWITDDAVAEAFAQAIQRGSAIRDPERWVWAAAFKIAAGALKNRRATTELTTEQSHTDPDPPWDLIDALAELPERQRAAVVLHHYAGYPATEIARMLGSSAPAIRMHLTRGRRRLRVAMEGGDDRG